jgi:hypothetical protein
MPCECSTTWSKWARIGAGGWVIAKVTSQCMPVPVEGRTSKDGVVRGPCDDDPPEPAPTEPAPFEAGCRVTYELRIASAGALGIASFSTATDTFHFQPPIGPNAGQTVAINAPLGDPQTCAVARVGSLTIVDTQTGAVAMTMSGIRICQLQAG